MGNVLANAYTMQHEVTWRQNTCHWNCKKVLFVKVWLTFLTIKISLNNYFSAFCKKLTLQSLWLSFPIYKSNICTSFHDLLFFIFKNRLIHPERLRHNGRMVGEWKRKWLIVCCTHTVIPLIANKCFSFKWACPLFQLINIIHYYKPCLPSFLCFSLLCCALFTYFIYWYKLIKRGTWDTFSSALYVGFAFFS